jgi:hypothetical protein
MGPATAAKIAITAASSMFTAVSAISQGRYAQAAAREESAQIEQQRVQTKIRATQEEAERLRTRRRDLNTQIAQAAGLGFDPYTSRSFLGIQRETRQVAARDVANIRLNQRFRDASLKRGIYQSELTGQAAVKKGFYTAGYAIATAGLDISEILGNIPRSKTSASVIG